MKKITLQFYTQKYAIINEYIYYCNFTHISKFYVKLQ